MAREESSDDRTVSARVADRLTVLMGINSLLLDGAFGPLTERQKGAIGEMIQTAEELRALLEPQHRG